MAKLKRLPKNKLHMIMLFDSMCDSFIVVPTRWDCSKLEVVTCHVCDGGEPAVRSCGRCKETHTCKPDEYCYMCGNSGVVCDYPPDYDESFNPGMIFSAWLKMTGIELEPGEYVEVEIK